MFDSVDSNLVHTLSIDDVAVGNVVCTIPIGNAEDAVIISFNEFISQIRPYFVHVDPRFR